MPGFPRDIERERQILDAYREHGTCKAAARALDMTPQRVSFVMVRARKDKKP